RSGPRPACGTRGKRPRRRRRHRQPEVLFATLNLHATSGNDVMSKLCLSLAVSSYDRSAPFFDGRVGIEGCEIVPLAFSPEETFHRAFRYQEFDITEISMSSHALTVARGDAKYVGIPAFTSRAFRHSAIYIRTDRGIKGLPDLRGKTIGLPEYQQT